MDLVLSAKPAKWQGNEGSGNQFTRISDQMINTLQFLEQLPFSAEVPYTVRSKSFPKNEFCPLHYAPSIEILMTENVIGSVTVGQNKYSFREKDFFYIPPYIVHSTDVKKCDGLLYGIKISLEDISRYIDISNILLLKKLSVFDIATQHDCFDEAFQIMNRLIRDDADSTKRFLHIMELVDLLSRTTIGTSTGKAVIGQNQEGPLHRLITWTGEHYMDNVTVDDAAEVIHLSKSYFCKFFKQHSRITYLTYLNQVRIAQAAIKLREGVSVTDCSHMCGFTNTSYFIRLFSKTYGCTPGDYIRKI